MTFVCPYGLFVEKSESLLADLVCRRDRRKNNRESMGENKRKGEPGAAYATQSEGTYAENVKTSKKVAKYFLKPFWETTLSEIGTFRERLETCRNIMHIYVPMHYCNNNYFNIIIINKR